MTLFYKTRACRPSPAVARKACALLLIAQALQQGGRYNDVAGVSQSDWPLRVN